jgi:co-chaperonin GroES (HSP10)
MGQAKRKKLAATRSPLQNATELINRTREEITPVDPFERENWDAAPDTCFIRRDPDKTIGSGQVVGGKKIRQQFGTVEISAIDWLKSGDRVLFTKFGGTDVELDDAELVQVHKLQIYARKKAKAA